MLFILAITAVLGLVFGSFLNVCIARLPADQSVVTPRSRCPHCRESIAAMDNIPVLSWLALRARCRHCEARISWQYPLVELLTAAWFVVAVLQRGLSVEAASQAVFGFFLIGLCVMDWQTQLLPDEFTLGGAAVGFFFTATRAFLLPMDRGEVFLTGPERVILFRVGAILASAAILLIIRGSYYLVRKRHAMGLGDVKMIAMMAAFLGLWHTMLAFFFAVVAGAIVSLALMSFRRAGMQSKMAFGSFLAIGGMAAALCGDGIIRWYAALLR